MTKIRSPILENSLIPETNQILSLPQNIEKFCNEAVTKLLVSLGESKETVLRVRKDVSFLYTSRHYGAILVLHSNLGGFSQKSDRSCSNYPAEPRN